LGELGLEGNEELIFVHGFISFHSLKKLNFVVMVVPSFDGDGKGGEGNEFHLFD
jgi:hypothetical protein